MSEIEPFGWKENEPPDITATNLEKDRKEIGQYAQKQASEAQGASEAKSIPLVQKGAAGGVGTLDSLGHQPLSELSPSVASSSTARSSGQAYVWNGTAWVPENVATSTVKALGEVEGNVTPNLNEGRIFTMTAKGKVTIKKPTNWPSGGTYAELVVKQDATGGRTITLEGVAWQSAEPVFVTTPNAINRIPIGSDDGGVTWYAVGPQEGKEGPRGETGLGAVPVLMPIMAGGVPIPTGTAVIGTAFKAVFLRAIAYKTGTIKDISITAGGTLNGKTRVAIFDTGNASAEHYTLLWQSAEIELTEAGGIKSMGAPEVPVTAGQHVMLAIMNNGTTANFGRVGVTSSGTSSSRLPANYLPVSGGALPRIIGKHTYAGLSFETITEAQLEGSTDPSFVIIGLIE